MNFSNISETPNSFLFLMSHVKYTALQLAVQRNDKECVTTYIQGLNRQGKLRQVMYAACLFDNAEIARFCVDMGWHFDRATMIVAVENNAFGVAQILHEFGQTRDVEKVLKHFIPTTIQQIEWLKERKYNFPVHSLISEIVHDNVEFFQAIFDKDVHRDVIFLQEMCVNYRADKIGQFLVNLSAQNDFF